uniref:Phage protein n=1 Tax=Caenorhabditis tropicalis TaxID=1561998 RepID=A0A1I7ULF4_9PELO
MNGDFGLYAFSFLGIQYKEAVSTQRNERRVRTSERLNRRRERNRSEYIVVDRENIDRAISFLNVSLKENESD